MTSPKVAESPTLGALAEYPIERDLQRAHEIVCGRRGSREDLRALGAALIRVVVPKHRGGRLPFAQARKVGRALGVIIGESDGLHGPALAGLRRARLKTIHKLRLILGEPSKGGEQ